MLCTKDLCLCVCLCGSSVGCPFVSRTKKNDKTCAAFDRKRRHGWVSLEERKREDDATKDARQHEVKR